jgi:membrane fusion protein, multidrug efflux system
LKKLAVHRQQWFAYAAVAMALTLFSIGCTEKKSGGAPMASLMNQPVPVTVAEAAERDVPVQVTAIGNVEAYSTVTIKTLVDGEIQKAHFTQGQDVRKGDLLFSIDPRPFKATLLQAEANLARDEAQAKNARQQLERNAQLEKAGIISKDQYDQFQTNAAALEAAVHADQAAVETAKIQLGYCSIYSPIEGRTGSLLVYPGNLVKTNDTSLVVINQIRPTYVDFSVAEQYLEQIKAYQARGRLQVLATIPHNAGKPSAGRLTFINNTVDSSTGTIMLKATFPNGDRRLWPGQFVNVTLDLTSQPHATVVPSQAVQTGQRGNYIYVVKRDLTTELRPVEVGNSVNGVTVIKQGIKPGETVVTNGQLRLYPGAKVSIKNVAASAQESSS